MRRVLRTLGQVEREVSSPGRRAPLYGARAALPQRRQFHRRRGGDLPRHHRHGPRAEAALRASERRFAEAQQLGGIGVWDWNLDTDERWWSPVVYQLWGVPSDTPLNYQRLPIHPDDRQRYVEAAENARLTGELSAEWRVVLPDGSLRWLASIGRLEQGGRRILGVTQDVSERKQTETRLTLLLGELQHRVRNILGVVRSIVDRTVRRSQSVEELWPT